jgi:hypothetical protein
VDALSHWKPMRLIASRRFSQPSAASRWTLHLNTTWDPLLILDGEPVAGIGGGCGTCEFLFDLRGEPDPNALDLARSSTERGIVDLSDPIVDEFGSLVPKGGYVIGLFEAHPRRAGSPDTPDYFGNEQAAAWGEDHEVQPDRDYYRVGDAQLQGPDRLFEFLVPLQPVAGLESARVRHYEAAARTGARPTAVSIGIVEVHFPYDEHEVHWIFANYLIDGHHKVEAAARQGTPITVLSFISLHRPWQPVEKLVRWYETGQLDGNGDQDG